MDKRRTAAALIALSVVLAGALVWGVTENIRRRAYRTRLKSMYERSFFELVGGMDDLEVKLGKLNVSDGAKEDVVLLSELYRQADSAGRELSALPGSQQSMEEVIAFVNRLSEFSGMLTRKVADGGQIEAQDEQQLSNLLDRCRELNRAVQALSAQEVADVSLRASSEYPAEEQDPYAAFAQPSVPVPSLIYDGAFSQGARTEPRALGKSRVDEQRALEIAQDFIGRERVLSAQIEQGVEGEIPCWGVAVETKDAGAIHVQVTRQGGKVLLMTAEFSPTRRPDRTVEECRGSALKFLNERGFENLVPAYYQVGFGMATFNFVPERGRRAALSRCLSRRRYRWKADWSSAWRPTTICATTSRGDLPGGDSGRTGRPARRALHAGAVRPPGADPEKHSGGALLRGARQKGRRGLSGLSQRRHRPDRGDPENRGGG